MTILEIKNQIISHFNSNDTFNLGVDNEKIEIPDDLTEFKSELISNALTELQKINLVNKVDTPGKTIWVLNQPLSNFTQTVSISATSSEIIAEMINMFVKETNVDSIKFCDKTNIDEIDLLNLVQICHLALETEVQSDTEND